MPSPTLPAIPVPSDVVAYIFDVFAVASDRVAERMNRIPTVHEESLDLALIDALSEAKAPHILPSGVVVDVDVHFVGGGHHWETWEIADLGVIVNFRRGPQLMRTKVVLFQSKRLYPREADFVEDDGLIKPGGFGGLMNPSLFRVSQPRAFQFDSSCRYKALQVGDEQWQRIMEYEDTFRLPVHYLLYHPRNLPARSVIPATPTPRGRRGHAAVGARVLSAAAVRTRTSGQPRNYAPSYADFRAPGGAVGTRLPEFIAHEVLGCREGYVAGPSVPDPGLARIFSQRTAPISAAVRFDIDLGENFEPLQQ